MDRRAFIGGLATAGVAAFAGCSAEAAERPPQVPGGRLDDEGWAEVNSFDERLFEREFAGQTVTADGMGVVYEDEALAQEIAEKSLNQVEGTLAQFFATRVTTDPNITGIPGGIGRDEIVAQVRDQTESAFAGRLEAAGLTGVEKTGEAELEVATGETAQRSDFEARFTVGNLSFPVTEDRAITIEGTELLVEGIFAVWIHDDAILVSGGAFPAENFQRSVDEQLSAAIDVSVDIDMGLTPEAYREEVLGLIRRVE